METIEVAIDTGGVPTSFIRDGRTWNLAPDPMSWYERVAWWETATRAHKGSGLRIDVMVWMVQARIGHNPRSPLVTFELVLGQDRATWSMRSMTAVAA